MKIVSKINSVGWFSLILFLALFLQLEFQKIRDHEVVQIRESHTDLLFSKMEQHLDFLENQSFPEVFFTKLIGIWVKKFQEDSNFSGFQKKLQTFQKELQVFIFDKDMNIESFGKSDVSFSQTSLKICFQAILRLINSGVPPGELEESFSDNIFGEKSAISLISKSNGCFFPFSDTQKYSHGSFFEISFPSNPSKKLFLVILIKNKEWNFFNKKLLLKYLERSNLHSSYSTFLFNYQKRKTLKIPPKIYDLLSDHDFQGKFNLGSFVGFVINHRPEERLVIYRKSVQNVSNRFSELCRFLPWFFFLLSIFFWFHFSFLQKSDKISLRFFVPGLLFAAIGPILFLFIILMRDVNLTVTKQRLYAEHRRHEQILRKIDTGFEITLEELETNLTTTLFDFAAIPKKEIFTLPKSFENCNYFKEIVFFNEKGIVLKKFKYSKHELEYLCDRAQLSLAASLYQTLNLPAKANEKNSDNRSSPVLKLEQEATWKIFENFLSKLGKIHYKTAFSTRYLFFSNIINDPSSKKKFFGLMVIIDHELLKKKYLLKALTEESKKGNLLIGAFHQDGNVLIEAFPNWFFKSVSIKRFCEKCRGSQKVIDQTLNLGDGFETMVSSSYPGKVLDTFTMLAFSPLSAIKDFQTKAEIAILGTGSFLLLLGIMITSGFLRWLYQSLNFVSTTMKKLRTHQIIQVPIKGNDEFSSLACGIEKVSTVLEEVFSAGPMKTCFHQKNIPDSTKFEFREFLKLGRQAESLASDVFLSIDGYMCFILAEIPGGSWDKGFIAAIIKTATRIIFQEPQISSNEAMHKLINHVDSIVTFPSNGKMIIGKFFPENGQIEYTQIGSNPPFIIDQNSIKASEINFSESLNVSGKFSLKCRKLSLQENQALVIFATSWIDNSENPDLTLSAEHLYNLIFEAFKISQDSFLGIFVEKLKTSGWKDEDLNDKPIFSFRFLGKTK
ncbi:MAG: SpoIIE family protein phosphatase [Candidatus Riflebacteria bacterium]|nr:SpoIIE family protein phosphatase [Candidatus Riflebacteria bacterium]